jgi:hypothetical protein
MSGLSPNIVVLICIVAAAATVVMGFAVQKVWGKADDDVTFHHQNPQQMAYMREVRERNQVAAFGDVRRPYPPPEPNYQ